MRDNCVLNANLILQWLWDKIIVFTGHNSNSRFVAKVPLIVRKSKIIYCFRVYPYLKSLLKV
jgi:hypothetical protein